MPKKAQDIGIWLPILNAISHLSIITNVKTDIFKIFLIHIFENYKLNYNDKGLIIAFTTEFIPRQVYRYLNLSGNKLGIGSLDGYVNFTLSVKNMTLSPNKTITC